MTEYRYTLEPYKTPSSRYTCPGCGKRKTFSRYIDTETGEYLADHVGRCDRESNCAYHYKPKQYFQDNSISFDSPQRKAYNKPKAVTHQSKPVTFIPVKVFKTSLKNYEDNNFVKYLVSLFGVDVSRQPISQYFIVSINYQFRNRDFPDYVSETGATVFWQIDSWGNVRTGKIMLYNPITGKRIKEPFNHINWVHKALKQPEFELRQCLFGEHLLQDKTKPVALVESEKTAVIASVYLPQFIWLAVGSLSYLNAEKCSVLIGRNVTLFPDLNGFEKWSNKAKELSHITTFTISDLLELKATEAERKQGLDLADYLIKFDFNEFNIPQPEPIPREKPPVMQPLVEVKEVEYLNEAKHPTRQQQPELPADKSWEQEITELENYFNAATLPALPVKLYPSSTITDVTLFVHSHLSIVKANNGKRTFLPYLERLKELKQFLTGSKEILDSVSVEKTLKPIDNNNLS